MAGGGACWRMIILIIDKTKPHSSSGLIQLPAFAVLISRGEHGFWMEAAGVGVGYRSVTPTLYPELYSGIHHEMRELINRAVWTIDRHGLDEWTLVKTTHHTMVSLPPHTDR